MWVRALWALWLCAACACARFSGARHALLARMAIAEQGNSSRPRHAIHKFAHALSAAEFESNFNTTLLREVEVISLAHGSFSVEQWQRLVSRLVKTSRLRGIVLDGVRLKPDVARLLLTGLKRVPLRFISMSGCRLDDNSVPLIAELFRSRPPMYCDLASNTFSCAGATALVEAVCAGGRDLRVLDLSYTLLGDSATLSLATALRAGKLPQLQRLTLRGVGIGSGSCLALLDAAKGCPSLESVDLSGNTLIQKPPKSLLHRATTANSQLLSLAWRSLSSSLSLSLEADDGGAGGVKPPRYRRAGRAALAKSAKRRGPCYPAARDVRRALALAVARAMQTLSHLGLAKTGLDAQFARSLIRARTRSAVQQAPAKGAAPALALAVCDVDLRLNGLSGDDVKAMCAIVVPSNSRDAFH